MVQVRPAQVDDAAAIAAIHVRSWRSTYGDILSVAALGAIDEADRAALWSRRVADLGHGRVALVAEREAAVEGFLYGGPTPDTDDNPAGVAQVLSVHVDPAATGGGVGSALLQRAVSEFVTAGYREATLWVVSGNSCARRFYERAGWALDGASRREPLAVAAESGEEVTVVRYRRGL